LNAVTENVTGVHSAGAGTATFEVVLVVRSSVAAAPPTDSNTL
jgi:hypothetical protein